MVRIETLLYTAQQLEELLGQKYFYRQIIYRLADEGVINAYNTDGTLYFSTEEVKKAVLEKLARRIRYRYPWILPYRFKISFNEQKAKEIRVYNPKSGFSMVSDTENETEEDLLKKIEISREEVIKMADIDVNPPEPEDHGPHHPPHHGPHDPHHGPPPYHEEMMEMLRRIEETLKRIEDKLG